jgi:hypothetical protein
MLMIAAATIASGGEQHDVPVRGIGPDVPGEHRRERDRGRRRAGHERQQRGVAGEPAVVRIDQPAVPLVREPGDRDARGQVGVDQHDEEDPARAGQPQPHAGRPGRAEQARQQEEDRRGDADHRERDRERRERTHRAAQRLDISEPHQII